MAIAKAFNEDFKELADNGCDVIQVDEFVWPYGMGDWEVEVFNAAVEGVGCQVWVHTCWGNYSGTPGYFPDDKEREYGAWVLDKRPETAPAPDRALAIFPHVNGGNMDALNYEVGRTGPDDLKPLIDNDWSKDFVAGVIDVKSITETPDEVADCRLINLPRMVATGKLRALADGAAIVREDYARSRPLTR